VKQATSVKRGRRQAAAAMSESLRATLETIAMQWRVRKSVADLESLDPHSKLLKEFPKLNARALRDLRRIRAYTEQFLRRPNLTREQRKDASKQLHLIALVESEFTSGVHTAH
jgi:hypothetical protein